MKSFVWDPQSFIFAFIFFTKIDSKKELFTGFTMEKPHGQTYGQ